MQIVKVKSTPYEGDWAAGKHRTVDHPPVTRSLVVAKTFVEAAAVGSWYAEPLATGDVQV